MSHITLLRQLPNQKILKAVLIWFTVGIGSKGNL